MQGPCIIAFRSNLRPQFFVRAISPLVPEPKMLPHSPKTKRPTHPPSDSIDFAHNSKHGYQEAPTKQKNEQFYPATCVIGMQEPS